MSDRDASMSGGLGADDLPEPTGSLAEFYRAIDGTSRGRKRQYFSLDEIPDDEHARTRQTDHDEDQAEQDIDLAPLFTTPPISTDEHGIHRDEHGRLYELVDMDGEAVFEPIEADTDSTVDGEVPPTVGQVLARFQATQQAAAVALEHWSEMDEQTRAFAWEYLDEQQREGLVTAFGLHDDSAGAFAELWEAAGTEPGEATDRATDQAADVDGDEL